MSLLLLTYPSRVIYEDNNFQESIHVTTTIIVIVK